MAFMSVKRLLVSCSCVSLCYLCVSVMQMVINQNLFLQFFKLTSSNFGSQNCRPTFSCFKNRILYAVGPIVYFHTWRGLSANLGCRSETCCRRLAENTGRKNRQKFAVWASSHNFVGLYLGNEGTYRQSEKTC